MAGEKKIAQFDPAVSGLNSNSSSKLPMSDMARRTDGLSKAPLIEQGPDCYYYPGFDSTFSESNNQSSNGEQYFSGYTSYNNDTKQESYGSSNYHLPSKTRSPPLNSKARQFDNFSRSGFQSRPSNFGSSYPNMGLGLGKYSPYTNQNGPFVNYQYQSPFVNYQTNNRDWNNNNNNNGNNSTYKYRPRKFNKNGEFEATAELMRGPRDTRINPQKTEPSELQIRKEKYNLESFPIEYENAKFYVIKSYSEDDVHKSVKYDVWSSTANGNKKLDLSFRDAEAKAKETRIKCPIFLFFSVNASGQFLGVAEMIGPVDFNKKMDFWQQDKWNGFFPVQWHIVKDVPCTQLRHIVLESNDFKPVTHSRDTQEIGLKHGLEMLSIFKSYKEKTSILDDFSFYEGRERSLKGRKDIRSASRSNEANKGILGSEESSLIDLTKNLSLNSQTMKRGV